MVIYPVAKWWIFPLNMVIYPATNGDFPSFFCMFTRGSTSYGPSGSQGLRNKAWAMKHFGSVQLMFRCGPEWEWPEIHWEKHGKTGISWDFTKITYGLVKYHIYIYIFIILYYIILYYILYILYFYWGNCMKLCWPSQIWRNQIPAYGWQPCARSLFAHGNDAHVLNQQILLVGDLEHYFFDFPYIGNNHPNISQLTNSYFSEG